MIFFLLPFIFNPFGFALRWLPALYLAAWPVIIQTLGREALITHALILILFIVVCDITRATMLRLIGIDLISLPAGIGLIAILFTDKGFALLSLITPLINGLLLVSEPALLIIETIIVMDMIRTTNRWIAKLSNVRDDSSRDLSSWDPPLTRTSIVIRFVVILITIAAYLGTYMLVQESKTLLNYDDKDLPIQFNHAIAILVTLQTISFFATIYKDEGILSETAMVALAASVPIFIAAWSFNHLKLNEAESSGWTSYFPFSLFSGASQEAEDNSYGAGLDDRGRIVFSDLASPHSGFISNNPSAARAPMTLDFDAFEGSLNVLAPSDSVLKQLLLALLRRSFMVVNSFLGLSLNKLAKYYFGADFWYILVGRLVCLVWWTIQTSSSKSNNSHRRTIFKRPQTISQQGQQSSDDAGIDSQNYSEQDNNNESLWSKLRRKVPISRASSVKIIFIVAYAQMLIQQTENRLNSQSNQTVVQRLFQSIAVHILYLFTLMFFQQDDDQVEED